MDPVLVRVLQREPGRLDDVGRGADSAPDVQSIARLDQHAYRRVGAVTRVNDAHLVVGEVHLLEQGVRLTERAPHRGVEGRHRPVAVGGGLGEQVSDAHLHHRFGLHLAVAVARVRGMAGGIEVTAALHDEEVIEAEGGDVAVQRTAHQQFERGLGGLVLKAARFLRLHTFEDGARLRVGQLDARALLTQLLKDVAAAGELGDEHALDVADGQRVDVGVGAGHLRDGGNVQPGLVREGSRPHIGLLRVRREVRELRGEMRDLGQAGELRVRHDVHAELQLEVGDDGDDVRVAAALAPAVEASLHLPRAGLHGKERVGDGQLGVVVAVDANRARHRLDGGGHTPHDGVRQGAAAAGAQGGERIGGVGGVPVEEVLGVEDNFAAAVAEEADRVRDHRQVLLLRRLEDITYLGGGRLPDKGDDGRLGVQDGEQRNIRIGVAAGAAGRAEGDEARVPQLERAGALKELGVLRVRARIAALDVVHTEFVQLPHDGQLVFEGERQPFHPEAVAQGGVIQEHVGECGHWWLALLFGSQSNEAWSSRCGRTGAGLRGDDGGCVLARDDRGRRPRGPGDIHRLS